MHVCMHKCVRGMLCGVCLFVCGICGVGRYVREILWVWILAFLEGTISQKPTVSFSFIICLPFLPEGSLSFRCRIYVADT